MASVQHNMTDSLQPSAAMASTGPSTPAFATSTTPQPATNDDAETLLVSVYPEKPITTTFDIESKTHDGCCRGRFPYVRYVILVLTALCLTLTRSNELTFNFTVICMNANANTSEVIDRPVEMAAKEISTTMAFGGFGALFSVLPVVQLLHHVGPRLVFGILLVASGVATIMMSPLAQLDVYWMLPARFVQGIALSSVMPLLGSVSAEWAALGDVGKFVTLLSANGQLAQILTMPLSAQLCVTSGWSSVYTVHGLLSIVAGCAFMAIYRNQAHTHPCISKNELRVIDKVKSTPARTVHKVPYRSIAYSRPVWAVWIAFIGNAVSFQLVVQFMPTFLNKVVKLGVRRTGIYAVIPPLMQLIVKLIAGWASDRLCLPEAIKLRIFNSLAQIGCAICLIPLGFIHEGQGTLAIVCFTASISFLGLVSCGSMKSATLVARSFTHFVMAIVQLIICISMLVVPYIVAVMAPDNTVEQWRYVFLLVSIVLALSNYVFCVLCSAEAQPWAIVSPKNVS